MKCAAELDLDVQGTGVKAIADAMRRAADEIEHCTIRHCGLAQWLVGKDGNDVGVVAIAISGLWKHHEDAEAASNDPFPPAAVRAVKA